MLKIINEHLKDFIPSDEVELFDGKIPAPQRETIKNRFNTRAKPRILLLSLKAGEIGLNLTGANHIIIFDSTWNPADEKQVSDRIHRIGQKKICYIHKILVENSVEERVLKVQDTKKNLAAAVVERSFI